MACTRWLFWSRWPTGLRHDDSLSTFYYSHYWSLKKEASAKCLEGCEEGIFCCFHVGGDKSRNNESNAGNSIALLFRHASMPVLVLRYQSALKCISILTPPSANCVLSKHHNIYSTSALMMHFTEMQARWAKRGGGLNNTKVPLSSSLLMMFSCSQFNNDGRQ